MAFLATEDDPKGTKGAVLVEFVVVIFPLLALFFTSVQAAAAYSASLRLRHAAIIGVRAAAVILPPNPGAVGTEADIDRAVDAALGTTRASFVYVHVKKTPAPRARELVTVEITAEYRCGVPLGGRVMCGADGVTTMGPIVVRYPNQGAEYTE
jgi:hypothetical protein